MSLSVKFFNGVIYGLILVVLSSCLGQDRELDFLTDNCPINYKLDDVRDVESYYSGFVSDSSHFVAFKEFSNSGYKLVSVVENEGDYVLSVSLPPIPNGTISKKIDSKIGQELFKRFKHIESLDFFEGEDTFHPNCILVGIRTSKPTFSSRLYNPPLLSHKDSNNQNSGLRVYSMLTSFVDAQLPNHVNRILSTYNDKLEPVKAGGNFFYADTYVNATEKESNEFIGKIVQAPFFEIE